MPLSLAIALAKGSSVAFLQVIKWTSVSWNCYCVTVLDWGGRCHYPLNDGRALSFMEMRSLCLHEVHDLPRIQTRIVSGWYIGLGLLQGSWGVWGDSPHLAMGCWEQAVALRLLSYKAGYRDLLKGWFILNLMPAAIGSRSYAFLGPCSVDHSGG